MARRNEEFTIIFNENYAGVCRFLEGIVGRRSAAQDLAQDCFIRLYRARPEELSFEEVRFWLYRVARNLALNELKKRSTRLRLFENVVRVLHSTRDDPERQCEEDERAALLRRMLASLPEHQRAALLLREGEEMSYGEIARVLRISEAKVKVDIFRARQALRRSWRETVEHSAQSCDEKVESNC